MDSIGNNVFQEVVPNKTITAENFITRRQTPACNQVSFCDTFVMKTSADGVLPFLCP